MLKWLAKLQPAVLFAFCLLLVYQTPPARSEPGISFEITNIKVAVSDNILAYNISGSSPPVYTVSERFAPFRVLVDVAGAYFAKDLDPSTTKIPENKFSELSVSDLKAQDPQVMRFEFTLADSHDYSVTAKGNDLQIKLLPASAKSAAPSANASKGVPLSLNDFKVTSTPNTTTISIIASASIEKYTVDTIAGADGRPPRMYIDISDVKINELVNEKQIGTSVAKVRVAPKEKGARIVFDSASSQLFKYSVATAPNGLNVVIDETSSVKELTQTKDQSSNKPAGAAADSTLDALIGSSQQLLSGGSENLSAKSPSAKATALENDFSFSGYNKQRISVDFYKIDIHNVFRLFRQITDLNIIVDEQVQGSLTLALSDVPWDFALDIILNLMDLKKEERFNTIVIYPNKKDFIWPTRAEDNLAFQADVQVIEQEALVIEKSAAQSKEILDAKELMVKAKKLEEQQSYEEAASLYAKSFELWPHNYVLANRLSTLYLVNLGQNAKALFVAKQTLQRDPSNTRAALYAGIASANMQKIKEASEFFTQSISGSPPMKEALISYAAFSENNGQNEAALKLLDKHQTHYGESVDLMVGKARILDKIGRSKEATQQYKAVLASGFQLRPDLKKYIEGRLAAKDLH
ncbi:MAG: AMIN domain-containing protein [Proteobacteria bacterium]|nr:AMIN domain-containing protein [Pseudomonadota bacterium]